MNPKLILLLPLAGLISGLTYYRFGNKVESGFNLILDEIHRPKRIIQLRMAPLVLIGTLLSHLFGGSSGREGTAVQMGASLSDQLSKGLPINSRDRKALLVAGAGAGFGAAIGAPFAGALFGMEVLYITGFKVFALVECVVASFVGYGITLILRAPHSTYPTITPPHLDLRTVGSITIASIVFGLASIFFVQSTHLIESAYRKLSIQPWLRPVIGGSLIVLFYSYIGTDRYAGLGIPVIQNALQIPSSFLDPIWKLVSTALTVGSGFKGGEFIPLVFIGTTLGSALSLLLPVSPQLLGGLGFAAVFGAASNTPIACAVMATEIFGLPVAPYALFTCLMSYYVSGQRRIYRGQVFTSTKLQHLRKVLVQRK